MKKVVLLSRFFSSHMGRLLCSFLLIIPTLLKAQDSTTVWFATGLTGNIYTLDINTCVTQFKCHTGKDFLDIAHTPNGKLYGNTQDTLFEIHIDGTTTAIGKIPLGKALVGLNDSILFMDSLRYLYAIKTTNASTQLIGYTAIDVDGDFTWMDGDLYLTGIRAYSGDTLGAFYLAKIRFNNNYDQIQAIDTVRLVPDSGFKTYGMATVYLNSESGFSLIGFSGPVGTFQIDTATSVFHVVCPHNSFVASDSANGASCMKFPTLFPTSISENRLSDRSVFIYPNPALDKLNVELTDVHTATFLLLYDYTGRQMKKQFLKSNKEAIDISDCPAGIYFIMLSRNEGDQPYYKKIIKL